VFKQGFPGSTAAGLLIVSPETAFASEGADHSCRTPHTESTVSITKLRNEHDLWVIPRSGLTKMDLNLT